MVSAMLYPVASLFLRQAIERGAGLTRVIFISNFGIAAAFLPLLFAPHEAPNWPGLGWPLLTGAAFFLGQSFTILAIRVGDVSIQAPIMGTKTVFVAIGAYFFLAEPVPPALWVGAGITAVAVFLLGSSDRGGMHTVGRCIVYSLLAAGFYGITDILVVAHSFDFSAIPFAIIMTGTNAALSLTLIPTFRKKLGEMRSEAWTPLVTGSLIIGFQAALLFIALAYYGRATAMNILYSTRGLWGVVIVWSAGAFFANRELERVGPGVMRKRLAGALLLT
ncbi:MAG: EamA family transporter, partial [Verrucomicrobiales bacterium]